MRSLLNLIGQIDLRNKFNTKEMTKITMVGRRGRKIRTRFLRPVLAGVGNSGNIIRGRFWPVWASKG